MAKPMSFRSVYKSVDTQDIDVDIYLPTLSSESQAKCPVLIDIHGGAFMLGSSRMINMDQVQDCLGRGWIVLAPNHRLCPQVNLLEGPMRDCRDLLAWIHEGGLHQAILREAQSSAAPNLDRVFAFGTSSGGTLALSLGFGVPRPVAGIFNMYGPCNFSDSSWTSKLPHVAARLPKGLSTEFLNKVYEEVPIPIVGGVSLEGQAQGPPDFSDPRQAFAMTQIASGSVLEAIFPSRDWNAVDPIMNVGPGFPPTFIAHGAADTMVPIELSRDLFQVLKARGVRSDMCEIPGEEHTFAARMQVGSQTWALQRKGFNFLQDLV